MHPPMELSAIFGKFSKHQIPLCFVYRSRLAFKLQLISMIHSAQIYRMQCSSDCNVAASYLLMFQFEAAPVCISNNGGLQFQNCETWLYRWRSFSLYERFWIFNKKKVLQPLSILKIIFNVRFGFGFILICFILILIQKSLVVVLT